ncbi:MAG: GDP-mannose 4,6-dehydratase [Candidatus Rokubacteria bacterium]|nr:GDP-mannose 4,6-dehydratase [Candidatus Rokubacteria bacterium]
MRVLVTGGAGFLGSHTVDVLREEGHEVVVLDDLDPQVHGAVEGFPPNLARHGGGSGVRFVRGDVRDRDAVRSALEGIDAVLHLAGAVGVGQSMYQPFHYCSVNVGGTALLLDVLANERTSVRKLVVASSMSIYGEGAYRCGACGDVYPTGRRPDDLAAGRWEPRCPRCGQPVAPAPTREDKPLAAASIYAVSKKSQEELVLCFGEAYKLPVVALRYFNIYGPRQSLSNPYTGVVAIFLSRLLNRKPPIVFEDGGQTRDFIHVRDIARANLLALTSAAADFQAVNVGSGVPVSVLDVFRELSTILDIRIEPTVPGQFRAGDIRHCVADATRARQLLGWAPRIPLAEGMRDLARWCTSSLPEARDLVDVAYAELQMKKLVR